MTNYTINVEITHHPITDRNRHDFYAVWIWVRSDGGEVFSSADLPYIDNRHYLDRVDSVVALISSLITAAGNTFTVKKVERTASYPKVEQEA